MVTLTVEAVVLKLALVALAATKTELGTGRLVLLLESATEAPVAAAGPLSPTVQPTVVGGVNEVGLQLKLLKTGASSCSVMVLVTPLYAADNVTFVLAATAEAVALKLAVVAPDGTNIEAPTGKLPLLLDNATMMPLAGAAEVSPTLQDTVPGGVNDVGLQLNVLRAGEASTVMTEPVPVNPTAVPVPSEP